MSDSATAQREHIDPCQYPEGFKKRGVKDKLRLLKVAQGSAEESHYYLILAEDLGYGNPRTLRGSSGRSRSHA